MFCSLHDKKRTAAMVAVLLADVSNIDSAITEPGKRLMQAKYLQSGETVAERLAYACAAFATDLNHAKRLAEYISKGWFMFATPLLANGGTSRGLPISCFLNYVGDSREYLAEHYAENIWLSTMGGGIGAHWSDVRSVDSETSKGSQSSGVIPMLVVADAQVRAFRQGKTRQGAYAAYLDVSHPEILEFLNVRSSDGGAQNRKSYHIHIGVNLTDSFMYAVKHDQLWDLVDPNDCRVTDTVLARDIWSAILKKRMTDRGEPYLFFIDNAKGHSPYSSEFAEAINGSNLCTEITLGTDEETTAVCCLSSVNAAKYDEWSYNNQFIADLVEMLDNVLEVFINEAPEFLWRARNSAIQERSIGLGLMGVHTYVQGNGRIFGGDAHISNDIQDRAMAASIRLGEERGVPYAATHLGQRHTHLTAIAPNASSSIMLGVSPGVEPYRSNLYTVVQGNLMFEFKNPHLAKIISEYPSLTDEEMWAEVRAAHGSVQGVNWLFEGEKKIFRTFSEIPQMDVVEAASLRQRYIDQAQSVNLCFKPDADPRYVNEVHLRAYEGVPEGAPLKSLYYLRVDTDTKMESTAVQATREETLSSTACSIENKDECLACQG